MNPRSNRKSALGQRSNLIIYTTSTSYKLEPAIWSRGTGQRITWFDRCQLIMMPYIKKVQGKPGLHVSVNLLFGGWPPSCAARLHRRRPRRRAYAPTRNNASHDSHEKINSWVSLSFLYGYGAPFGGSSGRPRSSAMKNLLNLYIMKSLFRMKGWAVSHWERDWMYFGNCLLRCDISFERNRCARKLFFVWFNAS